jgi:hypothetical protein
MALFRIPYPKDPARRLAVFAKAAHMLSGVGTYEGTMDAGTFHASTLLGSFSGSYRALNDSEELEIALSKKPWLVSNSLIEHEVRKFVAHA